MPRKIPRKILLIASAINELRKALGEASDMSNLGARYKALRKLVCSVRATPLNVRDECVTRVKKFAF